MKAKILTAVLLTALLICIAVAISVSGTVSYYEPGYYVRFSNESDITGCYDIFYSSLSIEDNALKVTFDDTTGTGTCTDPYFALPLDNGKLDCKEYPYVALLVKTNKHDLKGEYRIRTTNTGEQYPCHRFVYSESDDYQLIITDVTDVTTQIYTNLSNYTGKYTNIRLDPFDNSCPSDTEYYILGYALYDTYEHAETFAGFIDSLKEPEDTTTESEDNNMYWKGGEFSSPASSMKMRWLSYGFNESSFKNDINRILSQGYGGIISNVNFNAQYLKDPAEFELLARVYKTAADKGMKTWIYDEYQWPSGKAFGLVLEGHDEYEAVGIEMLTYTGSDTDADITLPQGYIKFMAAELTDNTGSHDIDVTDSSIKATASGQWTVNAFALRKTYTGTENPSDFSTLRDVNLLDKAAVARFIEVTYQKYKDEMGYDFDLVEAFFTDEPQLGNRGKADYVVWSGDLAEKFRETYGYDIDIKCLFYGDSNHDRVVRQNYYSLVANMFKEAYVDQITDWCEANGTKSSGHFLFEENMNDHIETYGGNFMQIIGGMSIPGADMLWVIPDDIMNYNTYVGNFMGLKYVSSAAKNASKKQVMLEYNPACCDTATFDTDRYYYSIGGASLSRFFGSTVYNVINPVQSYTNEEINKVNTYVGRMNTILDGAVECSDLAVYYPIETIQAYHDAASVHSGEGGNGTTDSEKLNIKYEMLCKIMLQAHSNYTFIDDLSIRGARITTDGYMLIGDGAYKTIVLAYAEYMSTEALEKLVTFTEAGGKIVFVGDKPAHSTRMGEDAQIAALMDKLSGQESYNAVNNSSGRQIAALSSKKIDISGNTSGSKLGGLFMSDYETTDKDITFIVNSEKNDLNVNIRYTDGYNGKYYIYYPDNGKISEMSGVQDITVMSFTGVFVIRDAENKHEYVDYVKETVTDSPDTSDTTEVPSDDTTTENSGNISESTQTDEVTDTIPTGTADSAQTSMVETTGDEASTDAGNNGGCGSFIGVGLIASVAVCAVAVTGIYNRKKIKH